MRKFSKHIVLNLSRVLILAVLLSIVSSLVLNLSLATNIDLTEMVEMDFEDEDPNEDDLEPEESDIILLLETNHTFLDAASLEGAGINIQLVQQSLKKVPTPPPDLA